MSLDETGRSVWETKRPPIAILVAARATETFAAPLPEAVRASIEALAVALEQWWPRRARKPADIYEVEFAPCVEALQAHPKAAEAAPALAGVHMQMAALLKVAPQSLPSDAFYDLRDDDFLKLLRDAAKAAKLPVAQLEARLKYLVEHQKEPWPELVERARRMSWGRGAPWGKLKGRVRDLAALADLGATASWSDVGGQNALRLELDGTKRIAVLSAEELSTLRGVIPAIAEPA